jgi:hypothetical protein
LQRVASIVSVDMSWAWSEFPDIFPPVILHFGNDIGNGSLLCWGALICCYPHLFSLLRLLIIAYICIHFKALSP